MYGITTVNLIILLALLTAFLTYCIQPYRHITSQLIGLYILSYNQVLLFPSLISSFYSFQTLNGVAIANIFLTLFFSVMGTSHSTQRYTFSVIDCLQKKCTAWDQIKYQILSLYLAISYFLPHHKASYLFILLYLLINIFHFYHHNNLFHHTLISQIYLQTNLISFIFILCLLLSLQIANLQSTSILLFVAAVLSIKLANVVFYHKISYLISKLRNYSYSSRGNNQFEFPEFEVDFMIRNFINNYKFQVKKSDFYQKLHFQEFLNCEGNEQEEQNKTSQFQLNHNLPINFGLAIETQENITLKRIFARINKVINQNESNIFNRVKGRSSMDRIFINLFYLLQIEQNQTKFMIAVADALSCSSRKKLNWKEISIINYLLQIMKNKNNSSPSNSSLEIDQVFQFEKDLQALQEKLLLSLNMQIHLMKILSDDVLDIENLQLEGIKYTSLRQAVERLIAKLILISKENEELRYYIEIYIDCISPNDADRILLRKQSILERQKMMKYARHHITNKYSCVAFVSLMSQSFSKIQNISNNCNLLFGYPSHELLSQNLEFIQPKSISNIHGRFLKNFIIQNTLQSQIHKKVPLFIKNKQGFGIKVDVNLQIFIKSKLNKTQAGLMCNISVKEFRLKDNYILINAQNNQIDLVTENVFTNLMKLCFKSPSDLQDAQIHQIIPAYPYLNNFAISQQDIDIVEIRTLIFLPYCYEESDLKAWCRDQSTDFIKKYQKGYLNPCTNNIFVADLKIKSYKSEQYNMQVIKIKDFQQLKEQQEIHSSINSILLPQIYGNGNVFDVDYQQQMSSPRQNKLRKPKTVLIMSNDKLEEHEFAKNNNYVTSTKVMEIRNREASIVMYPTSVEFIQDNQVQSPRQLISTQCLSDQEGLFNQKLRIIDHIFTDRTIQSTNLPLTQIGLTQPPFQQKQINVSKANSNKSSKSASSSSYRCQQVSEINTKQHRQISISSQNSVQSCSSKKQIIVKLNNTNSIPLMRGVFVTIGLIFIVLIIIVLYTYMQIQSEIEEQKQSFELSPWTYLILNTFLEIMRGEQLYDLIDYPVVGYSSLPEYGQIKSGVKDRNKQLFGDIIEKLEDILRYNPRDIKLVDQLFTLQSVYTHFTFPSQMTNSTNSLLENIKITINSAFILIHGTPLNRAITDVQIFINSATLNSDLDISQTSQEQYVLRLQDQIIAKVFTSLLTILGLSGLLIIIVLPIYPYIQSRREKIMKLLSTIDSEAIQEIVQNSTQRIKQLGNSKYICKRQKEQRNKIIQLQFEAICSREKTNKIIKKKQISTTTSLSKFSIQILILISILCSIINIQPQINYIITKDQMDESKNDQTLGGTILKMKASLQNNTLIAQSFAVKLYNPYSRIPPLEGLLYTFDQSLIYSQEVKNSFQKVIQQQFTYNRHSKQEYEDFFFSIIQQDACSPFKQFPEYLTEELDIDLCSSIEGGIFNKGLLNAIQLYIDIYSEFLLITVQNLDNPAKILQLHFQYFQKYDIIMIQKYINLISNIQNSLIQFVNTKNELFYNQIKLNQIWLFISQVLLVVILLIFFLIPSFRKIRRQIIEARQLVLILQAKYILNNTYIMNYINNQT